MSDEEKKSEGLLAELEQIVDAWIEERHIYEMLPLDAPGYVRQAIIGAFVHGYVLGEERGSKGLEEAMEMTQKFAAVAEKAMDDAGQRRLWSGL